MRRITKAILTSVFFGTQKEMQKRIRQKERQVCDKVSQSGSYSSNEQEKKLKKKASKLEGGDKKKGKGKGKGKEKEKSKGKGKQQKQEGQTEKKGKGPIDTEEVLLQRWVKTDEYTTKQRAKQISKTRKKGAKKREGNSENTQNSFKKPRVNNETRQDKRKWFDTPQGQGAEKKQRTK